MARRDKYEAQHARNRLEYERQVRRIFEETCRECGVSVTKIEALVKSAGEGAVLAEIPTVRRILDKLQRKLKDRLETAVINGIRAEWRLANEKYDALIGTMAAGDLLEKMDEEAKARTMARNLEALEAFIKRKEAGLGLSQRVWHYTGQMREAMEVALELGIGEGQSAAEIARELKQYLVYPDKLFRRVRDKETGELKLSRPASLFHPGQGVYRSSYKNALRLALNETNIAYRKADTMRRKNLYFVVGIEVHLSNNHNCKGVPEGQFYDICDILQGKYPADFEFTGWHPNCYSDDSKVLTNRGWLLFKDVKSDDLVLSLNPDSKTMEWATISAMQHYQYRGKMVRFFNRSLDCLVTPDHRMVYIPKNQAKSKKINYCTADEFRMGKGAFYRGGVYDADDIDTIEIAGRTYDFDVFCEFMGYWLADGSCIGTNGITISQKDDQKPKEKIIESVRKMGYNPTVYADSVRFYNIRFSQWLRRFGKCNEKYIPNEIKNASRRQIRLFLDAFILCDGTIRPSHDFVGNRGAYFHSDKCERSYFTTSNRLAGDLSELVLKLGYRPSVRERKPSVAVKKDGSIIRGNYVCYTIAELSSTTATVFDKEYIEYDGMVYDLTLSKNHIMYINRKGRCFWGSNCRCWTSSILQTDEEFIRDSDGVYRGSVNEVKDVPPQFKQWVKDNADRIKSAESRGSLPYFLRDNEWAWRGELEEKEPELTIQQRADIRHSQRTQAEIDAIKEAWNKRREDRSQLNLICELLRDTGMEYHDVKALEKSLTSKEIIERLGGGDQTIGSCSSLAFAYAANRSGLDVLDYRGGDSRTFFARNSSIRSIITKVGGDIVEHTNDYTAAGQLLKKVAVGHEYYFACGKHAAIVRKSDDGGFFMYLELQSKTQSENGYQVLTIGDLKRRFGAQKSYTLGGQKRTNTSALIDIEKLGADPGFRRLMGYINTPADKQKKGKDVSIK